MYVVCIIRNVHVRVMEAEISITLTIYSSINGIHSPGKYIHN